MVTLDPSTMHTLHGAKMVGGVGSSTGVPMGGNGVGCGVTGAGVGAGVGNGVAAAGDIVMSVQPQGWKITSGNSAHSSSSMRPLSPVDCNTKQPTGKLPGTSTTTSGNEMRRSVFSPHTLQGRKPVKGDLVTTGSGVGTRLGADESALVGTFDGTPDG